MDTRLRPAHATPGLVVGKATALVTGPKRKPIVKSFARKLRASDEEDAKYVTDIGVPCFETNVTRNKL